MGPLPVSLAFCIVLKVRVKCNSPPALSLTHKYARTASFSKWQEEAEKGILRLLTS